MNLPTATVDKAQAKEAAVAYRTAVRESRSEEDRMLAKAYGAAAEGAQLLNLQEAVSAAGSYEIEINDGTRDKDKRALVPRLAIAPADLDFVWTQGITRNGACRFQNRRAVAFNNRRDVRVFPAGTFGDSPHPRPGVWSTNSRLQEACRIAAMVPIVPPPLRPAGSLSAYHVLWEADWKDVGSPPMPPGDPALLRHLGGDMFAVLAVWDLTEIERAVLAGRRPE
jgi:hypothetical protein